MASFVYTPGFLTNIERIVSAERLTRYVSATQGDLPAALRLYECNVEVSEALFGFLHGLEVAVRNSIHSTLCADFGVTDWYQDGLPLPNTGQRLSFTRPMRGMVADARHSAGTGTSVGKLVAELPMGFWPSIISSTFDGLWTPSLHKAFPNASVPRRIVHWRLEVIRRLRNRIAHHEPILTSQGKVYTGYVAQPHIELTEILECAHWVSGDAAIWLKATTRYDQADALLTEVSQSGFVL